MKIGEYRTNGKAVSYRRDANSLMLWPDAESMSTTRPCTDGNAEILTHGWRTMLPGEVALWCAGPEAIEATEDLMERAKREYPTLSWHWEDDKSAVFAHIGADELSLTAISATLGDGAQGGDSWDWASARIAKRCRQWDSAAGYVPRDVLEGDLATARAGLRWVPVTESLPGKGLFLAWNGKPYTARWDEINGRWTSIHGLPLRHVTHWLPIPKAPEVKS